MFVTLRIILENIIKGVILSFLGFFVVFVFFFPTLFMKVRQPERRPNFIFGFSWNIS